MLAISLGVYEKSLNAIAKPTKKSLSYVFKIFIGIIISIVIFSNIIKFFLDISYLPTMFLFIGLILGGFKNIRKECKNLKGNEYTYMAIIILIVITSFLITGSRTITFNYNLSNYLSLIVAGIIDAFATVVPGISGTALLMLYGYYGIIITALGNVFNFLKINENFFILSAYGIGLGIGIYIFSLLANYLFKTRKRQMYISIYSFGIGTVIILFLSTLKTNTNLFEIIISYILLNIGIFISKKIE